MAIDEYPRVLSIQSHVVHGSVGNKCAVFPLQLLGFEVDIINTVQFSNHTGYPSFSGQRLDGDDLWCLYEGMEKNNLTSEYTHLLTGYFGTASLLHNLVRVVTSVKKRNPGLVYLCDPVLGDRMKGQEEGKLYLPPELVTIYREEIICHADIVTPNQFEAELLTEVRINSVDDAVRACDILHSKGVSIVVITSMHLESNPPNHCMLLLSSKGTITNCEDTSSSTPTRLQMFIPWMDEYLTGTGDTLSALLLARLTTNQDNLAHALEMSVNTIQSVIRRTHKIASSGKRGKELRIVGSRKDIETPVVVIKAKPL
eukprot:TRINITY_DN3957_c0_g1_i1.p1 TRINITY_DN3957_c0_g1~~TRINITY_DN3957_c0_g1_i1.p1  ORF type:complete len:313 (+),score=56.90 TRINITY_DN3957_c0_g1_i1:158-1096(+)